MRMLFSVATFISMLIAAQPAHAELHTYLRNAELRREDGTVTIHADDPRPLAQALDSISREYGLSIGYEDPPYRSWFDLYDATAESWKRTHPDGPRGLTVNGGAFDARYAESSGARPTLAELKSIVDSVVADFNASGNPGRFEVRELAAGGLAVVGISVADEQGAQTDIVPILDTPITLYGGSMRADSAFDELERELQAKSGQKVGVSATGNLFAQSQLELPVGEMSARTALYNLISQLRVEFHWRAFYDAGMQMYLVNLVPTTTRNRDLIRKDGMHRASTVKPCP